MYEFLEETVQHDMMQPARAVAAEITLGDLLRLFTADNVDAYPVESNGRLCGIVSKGDAVRAFAPGRAGIPPHYDDAMGTTVEQIMSRHVMTVDAETKLQCVLHLMEKHRIKSLPVVDAGNRLLGLIARENVIRALARCNRRQPSAQAPTTCRPACRSQAIA
ncbi:CBS domain-containing protein [Bradyrhizobium sp.]|uniref:CBS domain-containing protein n=1 Tax=Bradyrhizobium sp. TaxID=376 RepID=UPI00260D3887|nr:CBS domain-containing protein [Bradyrhizobium sp.]